MKKLGKIVSALAVLTMTGACVSLAACGSNGKDSGKKLPIVTQEQTVYDIGVGGDYIVKVDLKGGTFEKLKLGNMIVDSSEYIFNAETNELKFYEIYIRYLDYGTHTFTLVSSNGETTFNVEVKNAVTTSFGETTEKSYTFGSKTDVSFDVNFSSATIASLEKDGKAVSAENYTYADNKITLDGDYLDTLYGKNKFTVSLSNFDSYDFYVESDCLFQADVDSNADIVYGNWFNVLSPTVYEDGWDGKALHYTGNGGNLCMFGNNPDQGLGVAYEEGVMYRLTFEFKNNWSDDTSSPAGTVGFNPGYNHSSTSTTSFSLNYLQNTWRGGVVSYNEETGVYSVTIDYMACLDNTWTLMFFGYDGGNPTKVMFDVLLDNILLVKAPDITPSLPSSEETKTWAPGGTSALWVTADVGSDRIEKLSVKGGADVAAENYTNINSTISIAADYLNSLGEDTTFVITLKSGKTLEFTVDIALSEPTTFDSYNERAYASESAKDMKFSVNFGQFSVKEVKNGTAPISADAWSADGTSFVLKGDYLDTLDDGEYTFTVVMDNAGYVAGVTGDEEHTFRVTVSSIDTSKGYVYGSMKEVSFRTPYAEIDSVYIGETQLTSAEYTFKDKVLTLNGEFCNTLLGNTEITINVNTEESYKVTLKNSVMYANDFTAGATFERGEKVFAYMGTTSVDGWDGKAVQITEATGGHFLVFTKPGYGCPWDAAGEFVGMSLEEHVEYTLAFDIKNVGSGDKTAPTDGFDFYVHGYNENGSERLGRFTFNADGSIKLLTKNLQAIDLGEGVYRIVFKTYYTTESSAFNSWDTICVEAGGYNSYWYSLQFDNVSFTQEVTAFEYYNTTAKYENGSNADVSYRMLADEISSVANGNTALTSDQYSFENGVLTIKAAYCETIVGTAYLTVTFADNTSVELKLISTLKYANDFTAGATFEKGEKVFAYMGTTSVDGWDGKAAQITNATGGHFLVFTKPGYGCPWGAAGEFVGLDLEEGVEYELSFEIKHVGTAADNTAPTDAMVFYVHGYNANGSERLGRFTFNADGSLKPLTGNLDVEDLGDNVYRISFKTYYTTESSAFNSWDTICVEAGGYNSYWYSLQFDNVSFMENVPDYVIGGATSEVMYNGTFEDGVTGATGEKVFAYMGATSVDGWDGKAAQLTEATGGHFLVFTQENSGCPWMNSGEYYALDLVEGVEYTLAFEIKNIGSGKAAPTEALEFYVHGYNADGTERLGRFTFKESGVVKALTDNLEVTDLGDGVYRIVFKTYYTTESSAFGGWDTICVEAGGYNSYWYSLQIDNVTFSKAN